MIDDPAEVAAAFAVFDGRRVAPLTALVRHGLAGPAREMVLDRLASGDEIAASWVLKALAEKADLTKPELTRVFGALPTADAPDCLLHLLQMVQYAPGEAAPYRAAIDAQLGHPRGLVRVWALDALVRIAPDDPAVIDRVHEALAAPEAAMRARARQLVQCLQSSV